MSIACTTGHVVQNLFRPKIYIERAFCSVPTYPCFLSFWLQEQLSLPLTLRKFESGLLTIQSTFYDDEAFMSKLQELLNSNKFPMRWAYSYPVPHLT